MGAAAWRRSELLLISTSISAATRNRAFMLMSLVADVRVTQLVNEHKGIHVTMPKTALGRPS